MEMLTSNSASQIIRAVEQGRQLQARGSALASLSLLINRCEDRIVTLAGSTAPTSPDKRGEAEALQNQSPYAMLKMQQNQPWFRLPPADESASAVESYRRNIGIDTHAGGRYTCEGHACGRYTCEGQTGGRYTCEGHAGGRYTCGHSGLERGTQSGAPSPRGQDSSSGVLAAACDEGLPRSLVERSAQCSDGSTDW